MIIYRIVTTEHIICKSLQCFFKLRARIFNYFSSWLRALTQNTHVSLLDWHSNWKIGAHLNCDNCRAFCQNYASKSASVAQLTVAWSALNMEGDFTSLTHYNRLIRLLVVLFCLDSSKFCTRHSEREIWNSDQWKAANCVTPFGANFQCKSCMQFWMENPSCGFDRSVLRFLNTITFRTIRLLQKRKCVPNGMKFDWNYRHRWGNCVWERMWHINISIIYVIKTRSNKLITQSIVQLRDYVAVGVFCFAPVEIMWKNFFWYFHTLAHIPMPTRLVHSLTCRKNRK